MTEYVDKTIWKYPLEPFGMSFFDIPKGAEFLSLQTQAEIPCLWFLVNPEELTRRKSFVIRATGARIQKDQTGGKYYGTFQIGGFVGHVFEL